MRHEADPASLECYIGVATDLRARAMPRGQFPAEEAPEETLAALKAFL